MSYKELTEQEQAEFIAKLIVVIQHDPVSFFQAEQIIKHGERKGLFDKIKIGHEAVYQENDSLTVID